ncbi:MAG: dTMP kinase [bacterium]|nr:dTMP kinase [bacterium]
MFVSFEGIDGSGKSTQLTLLRTWIEDRGIRCITVREPGATALSESIREILLSNKQSVTPTAELLLFSAARAQLVEKVIRPALDKDEVVLCDRYVDSTTAYQGYGRMLDMEQVRVCNSLATRGVLPKLTFFIDVAYDEAQQRMHFTTTHGEPDRMERSGRDFFERVREGYHTIARLEPERFRIVDGMRDRDTIHNDILRIFEAFV